MLNKQSLNKQYNIILGGASLLVFSIMIGGTAYQINKINQEDQIYNIKQEINAIKNMVRTTYDTQKIYVENNFEKYKSLYKCQFSINSNKKTKVSDFELDEMTCDNDVVTMNHDKSDQFNNTTGFVSAVFQKAKDKNGEEVFVRIATSTKKEDGSRAVGLPLGKNHAAYKNLISGESYIGLANTAGKYLIAKYEPLKDKNGKVIGAIGIASLQTDYINSLRKNLSEIKIGKNSYITVLNDSNDEHNGDFIVHPKLAGTNSFKSEDNTVKALGNAVLKDKNTEFYYDWKTENGTTQKVFISSKEEGINWVIGSATSLDEFVEIGAKARNTLLTISIVGALALMSLIFYMSNRISKNVNKVSEAMQKVGSGDLSIQLDYLENSKNEFDILAKEIDRSINNFKNILHQAQLVAHKVENSTTTLTHSVNEISNASEEQAQQTTNIASTIEELIVSIEEVAGQAKIMGEIANKSKNAAEDGVSLAYQMIGQIDKISQNAKQTKDKTSRLSAQAQSISSILSVIRNISNQTNLLALNAAIEAARAGEAGRGFAVVADEVRKLAEQSAKSTNEIEEMINTIQNETDSSVQSMLENYQLSEDSNELAQKTKEFLQIIIDNAKINADSTSSIAHATQEQVIAGQAIGTSVETITYKAEQNTIVIKSAAELANELDHLSKDLIKEVEKFTFK